MFDRKTILGVALCGTLVAFGSGSFAAGDSMMAGHGETGARRFVVRIENISTPGEFRASNGTAWTLDFSRGVWFVTTATDPLFTPGKPDRKQGLKSLSEDGDPTQLGRSLETLPGVVSTGKFTIAVNASVMKGIRPGREFEFVITAKPSQRLGIATMFGQSNDWFYAPGGEGIALYDASGKPVRGDVTTAIRLWDAGTEADEEPGIGPHQGPRQKKIDSGPADPDARVRRVTSPRFVDVARVMRVTVRPQ